MHPEAVSRRKFLFTLSIVANGIVGAIFAVPIVGYLLGPAMKKQKDTEFWVGLGPVDQFPEGETRLVNFRNPSTAPWDGQTADLPCWVRRISGNKFQVFAINCAHLGCPVRWFAQSRLFMCPCHGGAYYEDGSRASGPPERGLFEYAYKIEANNLIISVGDLPTIARPGTKNVADCRELSPSPAERAALVQIGGVTEARHAEDGGSRG
jgi:Rieske Fe-S protein